MISGIRWVLDTAVTAAEAEMNDDGALREQLLETEMRREMGEISDEEFTEIEADLLARIREIKARREGVGPLGFGAGPIDAGGQGGIQVEASVSGDFHDPAAAPHTTTIETTPRGGERVTVLDMEPGDGAPPADAGRTRPRRPARSLHGTGSRAARRARTTRTRPPARTKS